MAADPRLDMLTKDHMLPLTKFVCGLRDMGHDVPDFDPNDGGRDAVAAFLLESPGPRAVGSGFISRDNSDQSASNMGKLLDQAGFARGDVVLWNVVPYCVATADKNKNASPKAVREAFIHTAKFLSLLPRLKVVVLCGLRAQEIKAKINIHGVQVLSTYHPGAMAYNRPTYRASTEACFREAAAIALQVQHGESPPLSR